jgi:hypothetical protein
MSAQQRLLLLVLDCYVHFYLAAAIINPQPCEKACLQACFHTIQMLACPSPSQLCQCG